MSTTYHLPRISYWIAYQVLPRYAFQGLDLAIDVWTKTPGTTGPFYYLIACQMGELEPVPEDARLYSAAHGTLGDHDYYLLEFPVPPPVDLSDVYPETIFERAKGIVLAPHFALIARHRGTQEVRYFVLGQSSMGGGTTFRSVTAEGANLNLGPGPAPQRELFLEQVREALAG